MPISLFAQSTCAYCHYISSAKYDDGHTLRRNNDAQNDIRAEEASATNNGALFIEK